MGSHLNRQPASEWLHLPAESSPTLSPTPAAAFLSDIAEAGAGALWPGTPMHGWSRGKLRVFLDTLDRSSGNRENRVLHNYPTNPNKERSKLYNNVRWRHWLRNAEDKTTGAKLSPCTHAQNCPGGLMWCLHCYWNHFRAKNNNIIIFFVFSPYVALQLSRTQLLVVTLK